MEELLVYIILLYEGFVTEDMLSYYEGLNE